MRIEEYLDVVVQRRFKKLVVVHENQNMVTENFEQRDLCGTLAPYLMSSASLA